MNDDARAKARVARKDTESSEKTRQHARRVPDKRMHKQDTRRNAAQPRLDCRPHAETRRDRSPVRLARSRTSRPGWGPGAT